ncbi:MAG: hypothetical protein H7337_00650 [Rhizobacter sp.]|nr:hypothetical protein [Rhizobacter sp.]
MLRTLNAFKKCTIGASGGDLGNVKDLNFDDHAWGIRYLIINTSNWWLGDRVLGAPHWVDSVNWTQQTMTIDVSREAVKTEPLFDPSAELNREREKALFIHCDRQAYWKTSSTPERMT